MLGSEAANTDAAPTEAAPTEAGTTEAAPTEAAPTEAELKYQTHSMKKVARTVFLYENKIFIIG